MIDRKEILSPLGKIILASDGSSLTGLWFEGQKHLPDMTALTPAPELGVFSQTEQWLNRYFAGEKPDPKELPLSPSGSEFQKRVWDLLLQIPYGQLTTYGTLAKSLNCRSAQAVGGAVSRNPISIIIPCHRVVGQNKTLTGYAGGLNRKQWLLELEKANL